MKKKILFIASVIVIVIFAFFLFEQGIYFFIKPSGKAKVLAEMSFENYAWENVHYGIVIYDDGRIYNFKDDIDNVTSKKWYRVMYSDLVRLEKCVRDLDGEFEIKESVSNDLGGIVIYVYRGNEKFKIYEDGDIIGQNNSELSKKAISIIKKYY